MMSRSLIASFAACWLLLGSLVPAGAQKAAVPFIFTPQSSPQAQFAGYYVALAKGFYAEEGLDVVIEHPFATQSAVEAIKDGDCQASLMPLSLAIRTTDEGVPLVNILQTSMNSATMIISRWGVDPLTLKGAKVAVFRAGFGQLARCFVEKQNLDYQWVLSSSCVNLFVAGVVEATLARSFHEYYQLLQTGLIKPGDERGIFRFSEHGYNIQQDGVYMTKKYYLQHKDQAEAFARASRKGWEWALEHQEETLDIVMEYVRRERIATNRVLQQLMLEEVLRLQLDRDSGKREFRVRPEMVEAASRMLFEQGMIKRMVTYEELMP